MNEENKAAYPRDTSNPLMTETEPQGKAAAVPYSYPKFHIAFCFASCFLSMQLSNWMERCINALDDLICLPFSFTLFFPLQPKASHADEHHHSAGVGENCVGLDLQLALHLDACRPTSLPPSFPVIARGIHVCRVDHPHLPLVLSKRFATQLNKSGFPRSAVLEWQKYTLITSVIKCAFIWYKGANQDQRHLRCAVLAPEIWADFLYMD
jgi:hypothetical protein